MSFFDKLKDALFSRPTDAGRNHWFYVQCDHCGEYIKGRIDMFNDLSLRYGEDQKDTTLHTRKVLIGSNRCYKQIEVTMNFDGKRKLIERQIIGGKFVTQEEYEEAHADKQ